MSQSDPAAPIPPARLLDIDRKLGEIQAELVPARNGAPPAEITLSVGPFDMIEAVRAFERRLAGLPGVREVAIRGYEGEDRALIDVQLALPNT